MNKILKLVTLTIIFLLLLLVIDMTSIYFRNKPIFAVKESDTVYRGLLYNVYNCPEYSVSQIKFKNTKFKCNKNNTSEKIIKEIIDNTDKDVACSMVLDLFYQDDEYNYYFSTPCVDIIVVYTDVTQESVKSALKNNRVKISDLDKYKINYYKEKKNELFTFDYDDMYEPGSTFKGEINLNTGEVKITVINHSSLPYPENQPTIDEYSGVFTTGELKQIKEIIDKYDIANKYNDDYTREFYVTLVEILECEKQISEVGVKACRTSLEIKLNLLLDDMMK